MTPDLPARSHARPVGRITRGKTARNRLRGSDHFLVHYDPALLTRRTAGFAGAMCVDLGYGAEPHTTLEWADRLRAHVPGLPVLGVEIEPGRVASALPHADAATGFRLGGFNLPLQDGEQVRLVRAFNVLRQYDESEVVPAWTLLTSQLLPGGLLIDGTSGPLGRTWTACLVRRPETGEAPWELEALVLGLNLRRGFEPDLVPARLPKAFIHRNVPGEPVHAFLTAWQRAALETRPLSVWGARQHFAAAAAHLAGQGFDAVLRPRWLKQGWLVWRRPPVPA
ncbi:MAG: class I SAM-dependent methyltransferase [Candidatus Krumholzibacteriia bacterium]